MIKDYFLLAFKGIIKRGLRSWLTMIGIFIGIAAVVSLISLGQGLQNAITSEFSSIGSNILTVEAKSANAGIPGQGAVNELTTDDSNAIAKLNGVSIVVNRIMQPVEMKFNQVTSYVLVGSLPENPAAFQTMMGYVGLKIQSGRELKPGDTDSVVLTYNYYKDNKEFGKALTVGDSIDINNKKFTVVGLLQKMGNPLTDNAIMMMETPLRNLINDQKRVDVIVVVVSKGVNPNDVADEINKMMRKKRNEKIGQEDFTVQTPQQLFKTVGTILTVVNVILIGIAGISLVVGGIGIMNTMYTSVLERRKEIGIMKAIGARNKDILMLYLIESGLLGLAGGIIGIIGGMTLSGIVEFIANSAGITLLKASFSPYLIIGALLFSFIVGIASGVLPALQASKLHPIEALRSIK